MKLFTLFMWIWIWINIKTFFDDLSKIKNFIWHFEIVTNTGPYVPYGAGNFKLLLLRLSSDLSQTLWRQFGNIWELVHRKILKCAISWKQLIIETNWWNFGTHGGKNFICTLLFMSDCLGLKSAAPWGHSVYFEKYLMLRFSKGYIVLPPFSSNFKETFFMESNNFQHFDDKSPLARLPVAINLSWFHFSKG